MFYYRIYCIVTPIIFLNFLKFLNLLKKLQKMCLIIINKTQKKYTKIFMFYFIFHKQKNKNFVLV